MQLEGKQTGRAGAGAVRFHAAFLCNVVSAVLPINTLKADCDSYV